MPIQSTKSGIEKIIAELGKKAGIQRRIYPHLIRHTTATMALQHGMRDILSKSRLLCIATGFQFAF